MSRISLVVRPLALGAALAGFFASALGTPPVQLVGPPAVSPEGNRVTFAWNGDLWSVPIEGGTLRQLTAHPAVDSQPVYSRDGEQLAFVSNRSGSSQVYVMPAEGGTPQQVTWHSEGYRVHDWWPDGKSLLVTSTRDHHWRDAERMYRVWIDGSRPEELIVDAAASDPALSSDGTRILLVREGERWWRKGYYGSRAAQIWLYDLESKAFERLLAEDFDCRWPTWHPDDSGFTYTRGELAGYDLWQARWEEGEEGKLEQQRVVDADTFSVVFPAVAAGTGEVVYRHGKDLYRWKGEGKPELIRLELASDAALVLDELTRELNRATDVAFSADGLEIAFIAGGDVWVMDTVLREPRQVTRTVGYESSVAWGPDDKSLWVVQQQSTRTELFRIEREDPKELWWRTRNFRVHQVTDDADSESRLKFTPDGKHVVYVRNRGELWVRRLEDGKMWQIAGGFDPPQFDISPDSRWVAYSQTDDNFNRDIFIAALDGSRAPVNVSQHPDDDQWPTFSRDGKLLAYTGLQVDGEPDIYYVYLEREEDEKSSRERKLAEAMEKLAEAREKEKSNGASDGEESQKEAEKEGDKKSRDEKKSGKSKVVEIDFDKIHERVRRVAIGGAHERSLLWIDDQKLLFQAEINGRRGTWSLEFPDKLDPKFFSSTDLDDAVWSPKAKALFGNDGGTPARVSAKGAVERYGFRVRQTVSRSARFAHAFDVAWRTMRDRWYDPRLGNKHWEEVRRRYHGMAAQATDERQFAEVVELMLGELNGSHLGFRPRSESQGWQGPEFAPVTPHLGLRFVPGSDGEGFEIRDVLPGGPADRAELAVAPGDRVMAIDGTPLGADTDLGRLLTGRLDRDIQLTIKPRRRGAEEPGEARDIVLRPITYGRARGLLYDAWLERNRCRVEELSQGKLGYLHIRQMNMGSFSEFERQLYAAGNGKEGLVIDVRDNGGGSTADLLLTSLTQPRHAITVPRGGGPGYPQSRMVFATWHKPIVVLCNQNSFSNAEIFSHAIKTLGRGKLVGVPTAGGVISTGSTGVIDVGTMRMPFRGWFVLGSGTDMELAGAVPDVIVWPRPGEIPQGIDRQLDRGVEVLAEEVADQPAMPELQYATERERKG